MRDTSVDLSEYFEFIIAYKLKNCERWDSVFTTVEPPNNDVKKNTYFPSDKGGTGIGRKQRFLGLRMKKTAWKSDHK